MNDPEIEPWDRETTNDDTTNDDTTGDDLNERAVLTPVALESPPQQLSPEVDSFLKDANTRIDAFFERQKRAKRMGFFPSDYHQAYDVLMAVRGLDRNATRLCEWGSGFGVVAGLGALAGYEACGIEIDPRLIRVSRTLVEDHHLHVDILEGSFIPEDYPAEQFFADSDALTILSGSGATDEVDVSIDDFDVIFAFPWPSEDEMYLDLFTRYAADGALLITYHALEEFHLFRKTTRRGDDHIE